MATLRSVNWLPQQRVDISHLQQVESAVAEDFNATVNRVLGGGSSGTPAVRVFSGFTIGYELNKSVSLVHLTSSSNIATCNLGVVEYSGTAWTLTGSFQPSTGNYIYARVTMVPGASTSVRTFKGADDVEFTQTVPDALVQNVQFIVSNIVPLPTDIAMAYVTTNSTNMVTSVKDTRNYFWRLGRTTEYAYTDLPTNEVAQTDTGAGNPFYGGDRYVTSLDSWMRLVQSKLWAVGGGQHWYNPGSDARDLKVIQTSATSFSKHASLANTFSWSGLKVVFGNAAGWYNVINNGTDVTVPDGSCLYVDLDRTSNATVTAAVATITTLGASSTNGPAHRLVIGWAVSGELYTRNENFAVGGTGSVATVGTYGNVKLGSPAQGPDTAVPTLNRYTGAPASTDYNAVATGVTRGDTSGQGMGPGIVSFGTGANDTDIKIGSATAATLSIKAGQTLNDTGASVTSGNLVEWKNAGVLAAALKFDGSSATSKDLLIRGSLGWGIGRLGSMASGTYNYSASDVAGNVVGAWGSTSDDGITISVETI